MTRLVSDISDCHPHIQTYWDELQAGTDDNDPDLRDSTTTRRYGQDLRWYQAWLNDQDLDFEEVERTDAKRVGITLGNEYNGSTAPNRWRTIHRLYPIWLSRGCSRPTRSLRTMTQESKP